MMVFKRVFLALICVGGFALLVVAEAKVDRFPVMVDGLWGYIDRTGSLVIEPRFASAAEFSDGLASVSFSRHASECGYIDETGTVAIAPKFDHCGDFREGMAVIGKGSKFGYIDPKGNVVVQPKWDMAWDFSNGRARVAKGVFDAERFGFIDRKGELVIDPTFIYAGDFNEDRALAAVQAKPGLKLGFIGTNGKWVVEPRYGLAGRFSEGLSCVVRSGNAFVSHDGVLELHTDEDEKREAVYIDRSGKRAFTNVFDSCGEFSEGLAAVEFEGKWVFINSEGKIILRTVFGSEVIVSSFSNGLAAINFNGKAKYIDRTGEVELETDFDWAENFTDGIARVKKIDSKGNESIGYIDKTGRVLWHPSR